MKLLVVGAGEMGRWFAEVVRAELDDLELAFADADSSVAEAAASQFDARAVALSTDERSTGKSSGSVRDEQFDAVCVAVPISAAAEAIEAHAPAAERALVDVTGEMTETVSAMQAVAPERERLSLHPLFSASSAPGNVAVVADESGPVTDRILDALMAAGNDLVETTPQMHDEAMETVQTKTHAAVLAFALAADDVPEGLTTPVFENLRSVAEQVTGNTPEVYAEIQETFGGSEEVAAAAAELAEADAEEFAELYQQASDALKQGDNE